MKKAILAVLVAATVFGGFGCASLGDSEYVEIFKETVLPVLKAEGAAQAKQYVAKMVADGKISQAQADAINALIDRLAEKVGE